MEEARRWGGKKGCRREEEERGETKEEEWKDGRVME
jgi:hypothetical protein